MKEEIIELVKKYWHCSHHSCQGCNCIKESEEMEQEIYFLIKKAKEEEREEILGMIEEEVFKDGRIWLFHNLKQKLKEGK